MKYRRPSRFRRVAKWVGLAVCVFLTTAWAFSTIYQFAVTRPIIPRIQSGTADTYSAGKKIATGPPLYWFRCDSLFMGRLIINGLSSAKNASAWIIGPFPPHLSASGLGLVLPRWQITKVPTRLAVTVPMWLPLVVFAIPTAILWRRDRRTVPLGHCPHCGYNLTGNESGVCPECATPVPKQETTG